MKELLKREIIIKSMQMAESDTRMHKKITYPDQMGTANRLTLINRSLQKTITIKRRTNPQAYQTTRQFYHNN